MISEASRLKVKFLMDDEFYRNAKIHTPFVDAHQAYAVLLEECEEATEAMEDINHKLEAVWRRVRCDDVTACTLKVIKSNAVDLALEAIQVGAVATKFLKMLE